MNMEIKDMFLDIDEFFSIDCKKTTIYLHHTAGSHNPNNVIHGWNTDKNLDSSVRRIATAFVIGGKSTKDNNLTYDGQILRCFPETKWAWHLGANNSLLEKISIGIEMCNYGQLNKSKNGQYITYVNTIVPEDQVVELEKPFKGYIYYHKYTDKQLDSLRNLLIYLGNKFEIDLKMGLVEWINKENLIMPNNLSILGQQKWLNRFGFVGKNGKKLDEDGEWGQNTSWAIKSMGKSAFEFNPLTKTGYPGIWSHSSVREDKNDLSPQPNLISMLKSL